MSYTVQQLAKLAEVSIRTLHHYDEIGLLRPARIAQNGYRQYEEAELTLLQQILFYRELEFPLAEIQRILTNPRFNRRVALLDQKRLLLLRRKRLDGLLKTLETTLTHLSEETSMKDQDLYAGFSSKEVEEYTKEAKERWGNTDAYKQSQERTKQMTKEDMERVQKAADELLKELVRNMDKGVKSPEVQTLIAKHYAGLRAFYEPSFEMYRGLGTMYVEDARFAAYFEKYHVNLPVFIRDAMHAYCDAEEAKT